jgi:uncharacterized protein (DUF736 family)
MAYDQKDNTGSLFVNVEKRSENFPDYSGSVRIEGADWWISGWKKQSKDGKTFLSLSVKRKDGTAARPDQAAEFKQAVKKNFPDADFEDSVPF